MTGIRVGGYAANLVTESAYIDVDIIGAKTIRSVDVRINDLSPIGEFDLRGPPVPAPASLLLLVFGKGALIALRRRTRSRSGEQTGVGAGSFSRSHGGSNDGK
ncbi:hypothetical protein N9W17_03570 [Jannaschia sp.]|nr:hypothetical protein [Jannaschia sp.]